MTANTPPSSEALHLSDAQVSALQLCLAEQIGPAARIVMARVLGKWSSEGQTPEAAYQSLLSALAVFIESDTKRSAFLECAKNLR
jgi:hypothetical protein